MQLFALNQQQHLVSVELAKRRENYLCPECACALRVRGGAKRQKHFYHLHPNPSCRQNGKSLVHLLLQKHLQQLIGPQDCSLEKPFKLINRIADFVWHSKKIVFEIQCSPLPAHEVEARNKDYLSMGYQVVWILHEKNFNKSFASSAELFLRNHPFYYTNIDEHGFGLIYDQFHLYDNAQKCYCIKPFPINLSKVIALPQLHEGYLPAFLKERLKKWSFYFEGDLIDLALQNKAPSELLLEMKKAEAAFKASRPKRSFHFIIAALCRPYKTLLHHLLQKCCR